MRTIEIDEDIYAHLLSKTTQFGESASNVLRRELKLGGLTKKDTSAAASHELSAFLTGSRMRFGSRTDKFLAVLAEAYREKTKDFDKVLSIRGRDRIYFARSRGEITDSGKSTQPLQIPDTPFWVMTNSPTSQKRLMLRQALELLGYSEAARIEAARAI